MLTKISNKKLSFFIALAYVALATFYSYWSMRNLVSDGVLYYLFYPASIFPDIILFSEREPWFMIVICQIFTLFLIWPLIWMFTALIREIKNRTNRNKV